MDEPRESRAPVIEPGYTLGSVTDKISSIVLTRPTSNAWFVGFGVMFLLTIMSGMVALLRLKDTKVALSLATLFLWLVVALTAATFQALWNYDDFYRVGPFVQPRAELMKK
jgi:hypothetical protein